MSAPIPKPSPSLNLLNTLRERLNNTLLGKPQVIEQVLACLLARGHLLLEDLPGLGKTTLAKTLAQAIGGSFARVQCTPDLLPGDITGFSIFNQQSRAFEFRQGPVFADILLADEINRATPRTQSALLEAMAEHQVTVDNVRYPLSRISFVMATQNPVEHHGTYPLPEAQLDRFAMKLSIGYPAPEHEERMLAQAITGASLPAATQQALLSTEELHHLQQQVAQLPVQPNVQKYLVALGTATRGHRQVTLGLSPRGLLQWQRVAQARAFLVGRGFVTPDDIQDVAIPVLSVRLGIEPEAVSSVISGLLESVPVPV
jgi:MoxR-like ATPase